MSEWRLALGAMALASAGVLFPASAHASGSRLQLFENYNGQIWTEGSDDNGNTWLGWSQVPAVLINDYHCWPVIPYGGTVSFQGTPAVISDAPQHLWVVAEDHYGTLMDNVYTTGGGWRGWCMIPGAEGGAAYRDSPAITSWGPGRLDVFMHRALDLNGGRALRHSWAVNGSWSGTWETLGTGLMQGSPSAVSWGVNRIDVFARGGGNELAHKYFNGHWSGWENLGNVLTEAPAVTSTGPGNLTVFYRGTDAVLYSRTYANGWSLSNYLGGILGDLTTPSGGRVMPTASSMAPGTADVFVLGSDNASWWQNSFNGSWWSGFKFQGPLSLDVAITYWQPFYQPPDDGGGDGGGGGGCFITCP